MSVTWSGIESQLETRWINVSGEKERYQDFPAKDCSLIHSPPFICVM